jgi:hypothetical protein
VRNWFQSLLSNATCTATPRPHLLPCGGGAVQAESSLPIAPESHRSLVSTQEAAYQVKTRFQAFAFKWVNLYRYRSVKSKRDYLKVGLYKLTRSLKPTNWFHSTLEPVK